MFVALEKHWHVISVLLLLILLAGLIFSPALTGILARLVLVLGLGMAVAFIIRGQVQAYGEGKIDRAMMFRSVFFEVLGLLITIALSIFLVQVIVGIANPLIGGGWLGIGITIALSLLVGLGAAWLVKVTWGRLTKA